MLFKPLTSTILLTISLLAHSAVGLALPEANAEPEPEPDTGVVITGDQVAILYQYNTTSTSSTIVDGAKQCKTPRTIVKLNKNACWTPNSNVLGLLISSIVGGCDVYGFATTDCSGDGEQLSGATCFDIPDNGGPLSLYTQC